MKKNPLLALLLFAALVTLTAAGASRYINGTEIPNAVTLLYSTGSQAATLGATTATSLGVSGNAAVTGTLGVTGVATFNGIASFATYRADIFGPATAGTTQTQAGATALSKTFNRVTTGNANDGVALPAGTSPMCVWVTNISANALKVYGANADDDTIDGGAADAAVTHAASAKAIWYCTSNGVAWTSGN